MAKRLRLRMLEFAKGLGAVRGDGQADWYTVAEALALIATPELLEEDRAVTRGAGRPKKNDGELLAMEVHRVMWALGGSVEDACAHIEAGGDVPLLTAPWTIAKDGTPRQVHSGKRWTRGSPWKGVKAATLARKYYLWREAYTEYQKKFKKFTAKIP